MPNVDRREGSQERTTLLAAGAAPGRGQQPLRGRGPIGSAALPTFAPGAGEEISSGDKYGDAFPGLDR